MSNAFEVWKKATKDRKKNLDSGIGDDSDVMPRRKIGEQIRKKKKKKIKD